MTDNDKVCLAVAATFFTCGYIYGASSAQDRIAKRLARRKKMVTRGLESVIRRAREENLSDEEFNRELEIELSFLQIANRIEG